MSDLVLARVRPVGMRGSIYSAEGPPEIHAFRVVGQTLVSAYGGYTVDTEPAEYVEDFVGNPMQGALVGVECQQRADAQS